MRDDELWGYTTFRQSHMCAMVKTWRIGYGHPIIRMLKYAESYGMRTTITKGIAIPYDGYMCACINMFIDI